MEKALLELRDCKNLKEVDAFIDKHFPKGLHEELHKPKDEKSMFYPSGAYIGFNLHRYIYNNKLAAFCHAVRDNFCGYGGVFFRGTNEEKINFLTDGYQGWIEEQNLPNKSADELLYSDHPLTDSQKKWLRNFNDIWETEID
jgi:hypothetical protein